jgi:hypothetical protein
MLRLSLEELSLPSSTHPLPIWILFTSYTSSIFVVFHDQKLEQSFTPPLMLFHFCILDHCTNCLLNFFRAIVFFFALTSQSRSNRLMLKMILVGGINLFLHPIPFRYQGRNVNMMIDTPKQLSKFAR